MAGSHAFAKLAPIGSPVIRQIRSFANRWTHLVRRNPGLPNLTLDGAPPLKDAPVSSAQRVSGTYRVLVAADVGKSYGNPRRVGGLFRRVVEDASRRPARSRRSCPAPRVPVSLFFDDLPEKMHYPVS
jgi:hypothetical protein